MEEIAMFTSQERGWHFHSPKTSISLRQQYFHFLRPCFDETANSLHVSIFSQLNADSVTSWRMLDAALSKSSVDGTRKDETEEGPDLSIPSL